MGFPKTSACTPVPLPLDCQEEVSQRKEPACCVPGAVWASGFSLSSQGHAVGLFLPFDR